MVALTFDDGPSSDTGALLDALGRAGARATFFVVGSRISGRVATVARIAREGSEIGSHSWDHGRLTAQRSRGMPGLVRTSLAVRRAAGVRPRLFRPPYGEWSPGVWAAARLAGMRMVNWDVDPRDWESRDPAEVASRVVSSAQPGSIVLLHDAGNGLGPATLPPILDGLASRGLGVVTASDVLRGPA